MKNRSIAIIVTAAAVTVGVVVHDRRPMKPSRAAARQAGVIGATLETSRASLASVVAEMRRRVADDPGDGEAAVLLADGLMRTARVQGDAALALEAEHSLRAALAHRPDDYMTLRMLGVVLLSQHRFTEALAAAEEARRIRPDDAWNDAVRGDALLELGRYEEAFDAFDSLNHRRPDPPSYARAAYARELQGDVSGAIEHMRMAIEGTGAHDPEAIAWYLCQLGNLYLLDGRFDDAEREFSRAEFVFPQHPYSQAGRVRLLIAHRRYSEAEALLARMPQTPETWAMRGDIFRRLGDTAAMENAYRTAERLEREGWQQEEPQPAALARLLAERGRAIAEAVPLAERAASTRRDIHTMDALAWSYFQAGQIERAAEAIRAAVRTGTRDPRIRCHFATIDAAKRSGGRSDITACDPLDVLMGTTTNWTEGAKKDQRGDRVPPQDLLRHHH